MRVRVPASTTNLGHGFDCLGMALSCGNTVVVESRADELIETPGCADPGLGILIGRMRDRCRSHFATSLPGLTVTISGDVPIARGMGSSATILLGVAAACQILAGGGERSELIALAAEIEGHPDNVAAACLGGFTVVSPVQGRLRWLRFPVPAGLMAVVAIPPFEVVTAEARRILPAQISRAEAVLALQRTALITAALAAGALEQLRGAFSEAWHEGHRGALNPGLAEARSAASAAGAIGTILSGSGSSVLSFALAHQVEAVRTAVGESYSRRGVTAEVRILGFDNEGLSCLPG